MPRPTSFRGAGMLIVLTMVLGGMVGGVANAEPTSTTGTVVSFDGVPISYTLFLPSGASEASPVPVIFYTHGWGGSRATVATDATVKLFLDNGYAVLTWDARGFGTSGGDANVDSQEYEVKDVRKLIDLAAENPAIVRDVLPDPDLGTTGDPRMGMYGGSYAGGIQLETASADPRVDAIAPQIAWNDLPQALKPNGVLKLSWDLLLYGAGLATGIANGVSAGQTGAYAPQIHQSLAEGVALNDWSTATYNWFDGKSPKHYLNGATLADGTVLPGVRVPSLIIQGTSDTLFPINQGIANFNQIAANGVQTKMVLFCGGHTITPLGTSCSASGNGALISDRVVKWMNRWVKGDATVDTGARIEYQLQDGTFESVEALPTSTVSTQNFNTRVTHAVVPTTGQVTAGAPGGCPSRTGTGAFPGAQYVRDTVADAQQCGTYRFGDWTAVGTMTGPPPIPCGTVGKPPCLPTFEHLKAGTKLIGAPRLRVQLSGTAPESYIFFKLIDYEVATKKSFAIDDQVTAVKGNWLSLGGAPISLDIEMNGVAWVVKPGHNIYFEIAPSSNDHASSRFPGSTTVVVDAVFPGVPAP